jgi:hypothetical protein
MSELTSQHAQNVANMFIESFNKDFGENFIFDRQDLAGSEYDLLFANREKTKTLKVQVVTAVSSRGEELVSFENFKKGRTESPATQHLQSDVLRVEEAVGHKRMKYPSDVSNDMVLLIDFDYFPWSQNNLSKMKEVAQKFGRGFKNVYCLHLGQNKCERLL